MVESVLQGNAANGSLRTVRSDKLMVSFLQPHTQDIFADGDIKIRPEAKLQGPHADLGHTTDILHVNSIRVMRLDVLLGQLGDTSAWLVKQLVAGHIGARGQQLTICTPEK